MSLGILAALLLLLGVVILVLRPLTAAGQSRRALVIDEREQRLETLLFERENALAAIRDLQLDRAMGKLSDEDFEALDASSRAHATEILQQLDAMGGAPVADEEGSLDEWIEREVARVRGGGGGRALNRRADQRA